MGCSEAGVFIDIVDMLEEEGVVIGGCVQFCFRVKNFGVR